MPCPVVAVVVRKRKTEVDPKPQVSQEVNSDLKQVQKPRINLMEYFNGQTSGAYTKNCSEEEDADRRDSSSGLKKHHEFLRQLALSNSRLLINL